MKVHGLTHWGSYLAQWVSGICVYIYIYIEQICQIEDVILLFKYISHGAHRPKIRFHLTPRLIQQLFCQASSGSCFETRLKMSRWTFDENFPSHPAVAKDRHGPCSDTPCISNSCWKHDQGGFTHALGSQVEPLNTKLTGLLKTAPDKHLKSVFLYV